MGALGQRFRYHCPDSETGKSKSPMLRFFVIFSVLLVGLFTLEILQPAEKYVILPFTSLIADISVWIVSAFDDNVLAAGNVIRDKASGFGVRIEDTVYVDENGQLHSLTDFPKELVIAI